jgi:hypothetical protein
VSYTRTLLAILTLWSLASGPIAMGCSSRPMMTRQEAQANRERESIERPARPLSEEEGVLDTAGKVAVVLLIVGVTVVGILLPILLI